MSEQLVSFVALPITETRRSELASFMDVPMDIPGVAVVCFSVPRSPRSHLAAWRSRISEVAAATERACHVRGNLATVWAKGVAHCGGFRPMQVADQDLIAESFSMTLLDNATEHVTIRCVHARCDKYLAEDCIKQALCDVCSPQPYIIGGCFSINVRLMSFFLETALRSGTITTMPFLEQSEDTLDPNPFILGDLIAAHPVSMPTKTHCVGVCLTPGSGTPEMKSTDLATEQDTGTASTEPASGHRGPATLSATVDGQSLADVITLLCAFLGTRFPHAPTVDIQELATAAVDNHTWEQTVLDELALIADHFFFNKHGALKDPQIMVNALLDVHKIREEVNPDSHAASGRDHVELDPSEVRKCLRIWSERFLTTKLTATQRRDKRYRLSYKKDGDIKLTSFLRSFISNMLRKLVASKHVAYATWQIGLPLFLVQPLLQSKADTKNTMRAFAPDAREHLLQSSAQDMVEWLARLGQGIRDHRSQEAFPEQQRRGGESQWQPTLTDGDISRKAESEALRLQMSRGKRLCSMRDDGSVAFDQLDAKDQAAVEEYETGRLEKRLDKVKVPKLQPFNV